MSTEHDTIMRNFRALKAKTKNTTEARLRRQLGEMEADRDRWRTKANAMGAAWEVANEERMKLAGTAVPVNNLLQLCHPDRWQGSPMEGLATKMTAWILEQR